MADINDKNITATCEVCSDAGVLTRLVFKRWSEDNLVTGNYTPKNPISHQCEVAEQMNNYITNIFGVAENERAEAEKDRIKGEQERVLAENERINSENLRVDAEKKRVLAETKRNNDFVAWFGASESEGIRKQVADWFNGSKSTFEQFFGENEDSGIRGVWKQLSQELNESITKANTATSRANSAAEGAEEAIKTSEDLAQETRELMTTINNLIDGWVLLNPAAAMLRVNGDADPAAKSFIGRDKVREIGKNLKIFAVKDGERVKTAARGRLTLSTNGESIAIDGTEGDIVVGFDCDTYLLKAREAVDSDQVNLMAVSMSPMSWKGHQAKRFKPWAISPAETVVAQLDSDARSQAHSIYNTEVSGTYSAPSALFVSGSKTSGKGYYTHGQSSLNVYSQAQAKNADANTCKPYLGQYYEFVEFMLTMAYTECGTVDIHNPSIMGPSCTNDFPVTAETFYDEAMTANSGFKIHRESGDIYSNIWGQLKLTSSSSNSQAINGICGDTYGFIQSLEELRVLDAISEAGLVEHINNPRALFHFVDGAMVVSTDGTINPSTGEGMTDGERYYVVRDIPNCEGMANGVMSAVINCYMKVTTNEGVCTTGGVDISGASVIWKFSLPIYRGWCPPTRGCFRHIAYAHYSIFKKNGVYGNKFYCAEHPDNVTPIVDTTHYGAIGTKFDCIKSLKLICTDAMSCADSYVKDANYNYSLFCYLTLSGVGIHSYEAAHVWRLHCYGQGVSSLPEEGKECINASFSGCNASSSLGSARTLHAYSALSYGLSGYAGAFAIYPLE